MSEKNLNNLSDAALSEKVDKFKELVGEDSATRKILVSLVEKTEGIEELFTSDKSLDEKFDDLKKLVEEDSAFGKVLGSVDKKVDKFKELVDKGTATKKRLGSLAEKTGQIGDIFNSDQSLEEKLGDFKELLEEYPAAEKIIDLVEKLPKEARSLINTLNVAGEHGLSEEQLKGILFFKESS